MQVTNKPSLFAPVSIILETQDEVNRLTDILYAIDITNDMEDYKPDQADMLRDIRVCLFDYTNADYKNGNY
jgi:hypothetical protein